MDQGRISSPRAGRSTSSMAPLTDWQGPPFPPTGASPWQLPRERSQRGRGRSHIIFCGMPSFPHSAIAYWSHSLALILSGKELNRGDPRRWDHGGHMEAGY